MKEKVEFETPKGAVGWTQSTGLSVSGTSATKTVTMKYTMGDGSI